MAKRTRPRVATTAQPPADHAREPSAEVRRRLDALNATLARAHVRTQRYADVRDEDPMLALLDETEHAYRRQGDAEGHRVPNDLSPLSTWVTRSMLTRYMSSCRRCGAGHASARSLRP